MNLPDVEKMELLFSAEFPDIPPSANNYMRHWRSVTYKKREARVWQEMAVQIMRRKWGKNKEPYGGLVYVVVRAYTPLADSMDADNRLKAAQDALEMAGIIWNDKQAQWSTAGKFKSDIPRTEIDVWKILEAEKEEQEVGALQTPA
jgi:Holliday junction resolvase RusA-like endonuclease